MARRVHGQELCEKRLHTSPYLQYTCTKPIFCQLFPCTTEQERNSTPIGEKTVKDENAPMTQGQFQTMIDHIANESREVKTYIHEEIEKVNNKVDALQKGVSNLKRDMTAVKQDVSQLKTDVSDLKNDVSDLKTDMAEVKSDVNTIATELGIEITKSKKAS